MNYIYDLPQGWQSATSKDDLFTIENFEKESLAKGYKLSSAIDTNFFSLKVFEASKESVKFPWIILVRSSFNKFAIYTASLPAFLECCSKLLQKDVSA